MATQVARYRVYAFDKNSNVLGELDNPEQYSLTWTVHLANKKGSWVHFRGKFRPETWSLRNYNVEKDGPKEQDCDWPANQPKSYEYTNTRKWLIIDSGEQVIEGASTNPVALQGEFYGENKAPTQVELGEIRTDEKGRLLVFASDGDSRSIANSSDPYPELPNGFDADNWVDKMSDGTVRVTVKSKAQPDLKIAVKNRATIITAAPRFASGTYCPTTLYDLIEDVYEGPKRSQPGYDVGDVVYYRDIYPLFNRIYLLSWTTQPADDGHGPNNMDVFNDSELADPTADNGPRKSIFKRLRLPVIEGDKANEEARDKQANKRFMPYLSGDNGDHPETSSDPNDRNRWASLSQLQYGRLEKWSQGNFTTGEKEVPYESFDKIPLAEQPSALTRAPLERCVGAPMYPGIEVFWVAQLEEMYKLEDKYRFADSVTPGDLSKGLCLPWQSDFNMCNTYWWPSIRPDNVVTDTYFQQQLQQFQSNLDQLVYNLENRERWDRGIKDNDDPSGVPIVANSDMVRHWRDLGFVARQLYGATSDNLPEIYIEKQRNPNFPPA